MENSTWVNEKLGSVLEIKYGKDHKKLNEGNFPCLGSGGIMRYVDAYLYDDESILIPRKGSLNNIMFQDSPFWTVDTMFWSKIDKSKVFPKYLFYQLTLIDYENLNVGSAVPSLTVPVINEIEIQLPPLPEQKAIASVLSSLDDKIDLLHEQNQTLEALAETLFRQWFIERCPEPVEGEAKEDWEEVKMEKLISIGSGKGLKKESFIETGKYPILGANGEIGRTNEFIFDEKIIYTGRVGTLGKVFRVENEKVWLSDNTLVIKPINYYNFIYFILKFSKLDNYDVGSTQPLIRQSDIKEIEIKLPPAESLTIFENMTNVYFNKIKENSKQIQTLTQLRDTLLPKLMSGEVSLSNCGEVRVKI